MPRSEFTHAEVAGDSEDWRHECECRYVLDGMPSREHRNAYLNGETRDGKFQRGVKQIRGEAATERLRIDVLALAALRADEAGRKRIIAGVRENESHVFASRVSARLNECLAAREVNQPSAEAGITKEQ